MRCIAFYSRPQHALWEKGACWRQIWDCSHSLDLFGFVLPKFYNSQGIWNISHSLSPDSRDSTVLCIPLKKEQVRYGKALATMRADKLEGLEQREDADQEQPFQHFCRPLPGTGPELWLGGPRCGQIPATPCAGLLGARPLRFGPSSNRIGSGCPNLGPSVHSQGIWSS